MAVVNPATPYQTTLASALDASSTTVYTAASTGFVKGSMIVIGKEAMLLTTCDTTNHKHLVKRGMKGTAAVKHASGAIVTFGAPSVFGQVTAAGVEIAGYADGAINGVPTLPIGSRYVDPDTGYEYILCDSADTYAIYSWVVIDAVGGASVLATSSNGRVGVVIETVGASDKLFWVQVVGQATGYCTTDVTVGMAVTAAAGSIEASSSAATGARIFGLTCTTAHASSCTTQTAVFYLCNPFMNASDLYAS
jgi:hypothetical protein